ncbi:MAG: MarR family winged helix-turn-helix transcriptional regulator [Cognatishimia sp.]|nr:MarR family winged helix-turn-helix transcriptional regulator [Cognatishimia sp.]
MSEKQPFELRDFTPYLLNQAAEATGSRFQSIYKSKYGMLRTEWRVLFHLGCYGDMTAKDICDRAGLHKTKVSRAVGALAHKRFLERHELPQDRRHERLTLTTAGHRAFEDLVRDAQAFDAQLAARFSHDELVLLKKMLVQFAHP